MKYNIQIFFYKTISWWIHKASGANLQISIDMYVFVNQPLFYIQNILFFCEILLVTVEIYLRHESSKIPR